MLGYSRDQVIRAFIHCDRNIELTANYLMTYEQPGATGMQGVEFPNQQQAETKESEAESKTEENKKMEE
eukprot:1341283-Amorphochlora_amoeboformis.AAC.1